MTSPDDVSTEEPSQHSSAVSIHRCFGFEIASITVLYAVQSSRRNNLCYIAPNVLIHSCGNAVIFLDIRGMSQVFLPSVGGGGIGAVAVHPSKSCFAVCEKGSHPSVYVYTYPSLDQIKVLENGTEKVYLAAAFNHDGSQLATVGGHPDFWLTVWDWSNQAIILQSKAFSQDVFNVSFSKYFSGQLITAGTGHIKFWKMATTFTGLKLEGYIGKFGQVPLSDISGYAELSDGKVLSGTESGNILVWDGELIKCQLKRPGGIACHDGMIEIIQINEKENEMLTAGADGYVRFWSLQWLDAADDGDEKIVCECNPLREVQIDEKCRIKGITVEDDHWLIQDENGALWKIHFPSFEIEKVLEFHAGSITGLTVSSNNNYIATSGSDCTVRLFHLNENKPILTRRFSAGATTIVWLPQSLDPQCRTAVAGFCDGVIRVILQTLSGWKLIDAKKPHTMEVSALRFTPDAKLLATSSLDATVFFFHSSNQYKPLGFVRAPGPVTCMDWSPMGEHLLLGCSNGAILQVERPGYNMDTCITYELSLTSKVYNFTLPSISNVMSKVPRVKADTKNNELETEASQLSLNAGSSKPQTEGDSESLLKEDAESKEERDSGEPLLNDASAAENSQTAVNSGEIEKVEKPILMEHTLNQSAICALLYTHSNLNTFYVAFEGTPEGYLFECHIDMKDVIGFTQFFPKPVKYLGYSHSYSYLISGGDDGVIRLQKSPTPGQLSIMEHHILWQGHVHDSFTGRVTGASVSFDHRFLISVAHDGSFFTYKLEDNEEHTVSKDISATLKSDIEDLKDKVEDIGIGVYSIEEDRLKTEQDNKLKVALEKKSKVKEKIASLAKVLDNLLQENNKRSSSERQPIEEFEIDPNLKSMIEAEVQENIDRAKKELQWESEKKSIALSKLRCHFLDILQVEYIVVHSFKTGSSVRSFRTKKLSPELQYAINGVKSQKDKAFSARRSVLEFIQEPELQNEQQISAEGVLDSGMNSNEQTSSEEGSAALQNLRRLRLKEMFSEFNTYLKSKLEKTHENEDDIALIKYAEKTKGDFKLKSNLEEVLPAEQRTNVKKKLNEMLLLKEEIHNKKIDFNTEFLGLRDMKKQITEQIVQHNNRIAEINNIIRVKEDIFFVPSIYFDEWPENREIITEKDIEDYLAKVRKVQEGQKKGKDNNFGGFSSNSKTEEKESHLKTVHKGALFVEEKHVIKNKDADEIHRQMFGLFPPSTLEQEEHDAMIIKLKFEKSKIVERLELLIRTFDNTLEDLRLKRSQLEINIKRADLRMLSLYQELTLLKSIQPKEDILDSQHLAKLSEINDLSNKLMEHDKLLESKKQEVNDINEKKRQLLEEFEMVLGDDNPSKDALLKIYLKKIKLAKTLGNEENEDLGDDLDLEGSEGSDDDFDEDEVAETCPPGCAMELYQNVCKLRERRTIEDHQLIESNKQLDAFQREREIKAKKKKAMENALLAIEKEMVNLQKEKQNNLNQIDVVLTLNMNQIEYLVDGKLPEDLSAALVFSNKAIDQLKETIKEHGSETLALRKLQKDLRKQLSMLVKERKERDRKDCDLEQRVTNVQILKFGQVINLDSLDSMYTKKENDDLKMQLKKQETQNSHQLIELNTQIDNAVDNIARVMRENAACLNVTANLKEKLFSLEQIMREKEGGLHKDPQIEKGLGLAEQEHLCQVVVTQKQLVGRLKEEIKKLKKETRTVFP